MSGFLLAKKGFALIELEPRAGRALLKMWIDKLVRWIPLYWGVIYIFWLMSPSFHGGPVWY